jgi:hypothetical protein
MMPENTSKYHIYFHNQKTIVSFNYDHKETVFGSVEQGLTMLLNEMAVVHMRSGMLKGFFRASPFWQQHLKTFATQKALCIGSRRVVDPWLGV